jgi:hypothetical protein
MNSLFTSVILISLLASGTAYGADGCVLDSLSPVQNSFSPQIEKEVLAACDSFSDVKTATKCCKKSNEFIKKISIPCSESRRLKYQISIALSVCNQFQEDDMDFCVDHMLDTIDNKRAQKISFECLAASHEVTQKNMELQMEHPILTQNEDSPFTQGLEKLGDCEYSKFKELRKQLDIEELNSPADPVSCAEPQVSGDKSSSRPDEGPGLTAEPKKGVPTGTLH